MIPKHFLNEFDCDEINLLLNGRGTIDVTEI